MQYSIVIKFIKYFFISISIVIFVFLALKTIPTKEKTDDVVSFDSEKFSSASHYLTSIF